MALQVLFDTYFCIT